MAVVVAIDNGSQSTKVLVVDETGRVRAQARVGLRPYATPASGRSVHPDDDVWDSIVRACRLAMDRFDGDLSEVVGVGLCTIRFCRALMRADGTLAEPLLSWMDERVSRPHLDSPEVSHVTTSSGYIAHRLTGEFRDAAGNYQGVWPIDQLTWRWSSAPDAAAATGMHPSLLSELVDPGAELGCVSAEASEATGLPAGVPVFATSNDKAVEALGAGLTSSEDVLLSFGTYIAAMTVADVPGGGEAHWVNFGSRPGQYLAESTGIRRGMWTVSWLRDLLHPVAPDDDIYAFDRSLGAEAEAVAPGCDGVAAVLDWLAPGDEPNRRGAFVGFSGAQGRGHLYRAVLEAIAFTMADHIEEMERERGSVASGIIVTGGGAQSALLVQIVADVLGRPVRRALVDDAAGIGAAICAAVGAGLHPDWDAAVAAMSGTGAPVLPGERADAYRALRPWHRGVRSRVAKLSDWMVEARG
ncbi:FGGY-family carbohydrate kinase [uncultured Microbacterium sp.]|uniref:FGGY-family carbohydrate kinase n=1 Tax=uncultured Microbacterium sp. TaxID=191216 RepID=UPI00261AB774|nr:FGGY-family carbohydrate kinase [uncultured Microbacterium sp.]